jgi:hypothetical protein
MEHVNKMPAYFIVLEKPIEGVDTTMNGNSLSRHMKALDSEARALGVRPLSEFFSLAPEDLAGFLDGVDGANLPPLQQFSAESGLATVKALIANRRVPDETLVDDLRECERILTEAAAQQVGWHFEIDI